MENLGEIALQKNIDKNLDYKNDKEYTGNIYYGIEETAGDSLEKQVDTFNEINQKIIDILFLDDRVADLKQTLESVESNEVYYLRLQSRIHTLRDKIEELQIKKTISTPENIDILLLKIDSFSQKLNEHKTELNNAKEVIERYPREITELSMELEPYSQFLDVYDEQSQRFHDN